MSKKRHSMASPRSESKDADRETTSETSLYDQLGCAGRLSEPLELSGLVGFALIINAPAVLHRAGTAASPLTKAMAASQILTREIGAIKNERDRRVAQAAFAVPDDSHEHGDIYSGMDITRRCEKLYEAHGITYNMYKKRRPHVVRRLELALSQVDPIAPRSHTNRARDPTRELDPAFLQVAADLYRSATAATLVIATAVSALEKELVSHDDCMREDTLPVFCDSYYAIHVYFLLTAHRCLESCAEIHLTPSEASDLRHSLAKITDASPFVDILGLAYLYGGHWRDPVTDFRAIGQGGADYSDSESEHARSWEHWMRRVSREVDTGDSVEPVLPMLMNNARFFRERLGDPQSDIEPLVRNPYRHVIDSGPLHGQNIAYGFFDRVFKTAECFRDMWDEPRVADAVVVRWRNYLTAQFHDAVGFPPQRSRNVLKLAE